MVARLPNATITPTVALVRSHLGRLIQPAKTPNTNATPAPMMPSTKATWDHAYHITPPSPVRRQVCHDLPVYAQMARDATKRFIPRFPIRSHLTKSRGPIKSVDLDFDLVHSVPRSHGTAPIPCVVTGLQALLPSPRDGRSQPGARGRPASPRRWPGVRDARHQGYGRILRRF
jgi:hypothetical protein